MGVGYGEGFLVGRRRGLRLGLGRGLLLLGLMTESHRGQRKKQKGAEEGDVSCRSLSQRDQAVAFWMDELGRSGRLYRVRCGGRDARPAGVDWWH